MSRKLNEIGKRVHEILGPSLVRPMDALRFPIPGRVGYTALALRMVTPIVNSIMSSQQAERNLAPRNDFVEDPEGYKTVFDQLVQLLKLPSVAMLAADGTLRPEDYIMTVNNLGFTAISGERVKIGLGSVFIDPKTGNLLCRNTGVIDIIPSAQEIVSTATGRIRVYTLGADTLGIRNTIKRVKKSRPQY